MLDAYMFGYSPGVTYPVEPLLWLPPLLCLDSDCSFLKA